ncbi:MAG: hypothetical protein EHM43_02525 [Ignavibacteriae bacterium]|nr:MAG: hypothetical protein EHM43_02525 [Ignavibacteriota bacterium]
MSHLFSTLTLFVIAFQVALVFGAPWGELTWSGKFPGVLPLRMRLGAVFSALLLAAFALIVETRSGHVFHEHYEVSRSLIWIVVVYSGLGVVMNAITPSKKERYLWLPIVTLLFILSLIISLSD